MQFQLHPSLMSRLWLTINWTVMRWKASRSLSTYSSSHHSVVFSLWSACALQSVYLSVCLCSLEELTNCCSSKLPTPLIFFQSVKSQGVISCTPVMSCNASRLARLQHSEHWLDTEVMGVVCKQLHWDCPLCWLVSQPLWFTQM